MVELKTATWNSAKTKTSNCGLFVNTNDLSYWNYKSVIYEKAMDIQIQLQPQKRSKAIHLCYCNGIIKTIDLAQSQLK
jgi:hypothetical protein